MVHRMLGHSSSFIARGGFEWMGIAYFIAHVLLWAAVIFIAAKLINKYLNKTGDTKKSTAAAEKNDSALMILRERYAKGEIDDEEYKKKKTDLEP